MRPTAMACMDAQHARLPLLKKKKQYFNTYTLPAVYYCVNIFVYVF